MGPSPPSWSHPSPSPALHVSSEKEGREAFPRDWALNLGKPFPDHPTQNGSPSLHGTSKYCAFLSCGTSPLTYSLTCLVIKFVAYPLTPSFWNLLLLQGWDLCLPFSSLLCPQPHLAQSRFSVNMSQMKAEPIKQPLRHSVQSQTPGFKSWHHDCKNVSRLSPWTCFSRGAKPCKESKTKRVITLFWESWLFFVSSQDQSQRSQMRLRGTKPAVPGHIVSSEWRHQHSSSGLSDAGAHPCCSCRSLQGCLEHRISVLCKGEFLGQIVTFPSLEACK